MAKHSILDALNEKFGVKGKSIVDALNKKNGEKSKNIAEAITNLSASSSDPIYVDALPENGIQDTLYIVNGPSRYYMSIPPESIQDISVLGVKVVDSLPETAEVNSQCAIISENIFKAYMYSGVLEEHRNEWVLMGSSPIVDSTEQLSDPKVPICIKKVGEEKKYFVIDPHYNPQVSEKFFIEISDAGMSLVDAVPETGESGDIVLLENPNKKALDLYYFDGNNWVYDVSLHIIEMESVPTEQCVFRFTSIAGMYIYSQNKWISIDVSGLPLGYTSIKIDLASEGGHELNNNMFIFSADGKVIPTKSSGLSSFNVLMPENGTVDLLLNHDDYAVFAFNVTPEENATFFHNEEDDESGYHITGPVQISYNYAG